MSKNRSGFKSKGWKHQLTKAVRDLGESERERAARAAAGAAARAQGAALAQRRGGNYLSGDSRPRRADQALPHSAAQRPITSDSLPTPSGRQLGISAGAGVVTTGGVGGGIAALKGAGGGHSKARVAPGPMDDPNWDPIKWAQRANSDRAQYPNSGPKGPSGRSGVPGTSIIVEPVVFGSKGNGHNPHIWAKAKKGNVEVTVAHTEYVRDVLGYGTTLDFTASLDWHPINPGQRRVFAWLSDLADLFDTYEFKKLKFHYNPSVGTDQDGKLLMTFDPDVLDSSPETKQEMLEARIQSDSPPYAFATLNVPRDVLSQERYCRRGSVPANGDPHEYDVGTFYWATPGVDAVTAGELFVEYEVVFRTPNGGKPLMNMSVSTNPTLAAPTGTEIVASSDSNLDLNWTSGTTFQIMQPGVYTLFVKQVGTAFAGTPTVTATAPNIVEYGPNSSPPGTLAAGSTTVAMSQWILDVVEPETPFTLAAPASAATVTDTRWFLAPWSELVHL